MSSMKIDGRKHDHKTLETIRIMAIRRIREATIECSEAMVFHVDGEAVQAGTELVARVHPGALKICIR